MALLIVNALVLVVAPMFGPGDASLWDALAPLAPDAGREEIIRREIARDIVLGLRLPRVVFGMLVGASLALAGAVFQAALRNDLATPYTLGISGGSALGALAALKFGAGASSLVWAGYWLQPAASILGALACAALIAGLATSRARSRRGPMDAASILLAGVTVNILCGAGVLLIHYVSDPYETFLANRWLMGSLDIAGRWQPPIILGVSLALFGGGLCLLSRALNALNLGETAAHSLGVSVGKTRALALGGAGMLTAICVAFAGPIGFVGLVAPHAVRLALGPDNRVTLPASALAGGAFLAACDAGGRAILEAEVPVGLATALLGGPFFLWLLFRRGD